jgi:hypothetical protein
VYFITDGQYIKIGYTERSVEERLREMQTGNANELHCLGWYKALPYHEDELHHLFRHFYVRGEWFLAHAEIMHHIETFSEHVSYDTSISDF